jgi:hypothetical protein
MGRLYHLAVASYWLSVGAQPTERVSMLLGLVRWPSLGVVACARSWCGIAGRCSPTLPQAKAGWPAHTANQKEVAIVACAEFVPHTCTFESFPSSSNDCIRNAIQPTTYKPLEQQAIMCSLALTSLRYRCAVAIMTNQSTSKMTWRPSCGRRRWTRNMLPRLTTRVLSAHAHAPVICQHNSRR